MLIGDPNDFAIEAIVEPDLTTPSAVWGRMCIHIGAVTLGDFSDPYCALYPAYEQFDWHSKLRVRLWDEAFDGKSPAEIHDIVRNAIYGDDDRTIEQIQNDSFRFGKFDFLTNWGEQFDGFASVIVSPDPATMMFLHKPYADLASRRRLPHNFVVAQCSSLAFRSVSSGFVEWFDCEAQRLLHTGA